MGTLVTAVAQTDADVNVMTAVNPNLLYLLRCRVRIVAPYKTIVGGIYRAPFVREGGTPAADDNEVVSLVVSSPAKTFYLNAGKSADIAYNRFFDYWFDFSVSDGATLTLTIDNIDSQQYQGDASDALLTVTPLTPFDGIFAQVDFDGAQTKQFSRTTGGGIRNWVWSGYSEGVYVGQAEK